jgi:hypothetical protein
MRWSDFLSFFSRNSHEKIGEISHSHSPYKGENEKKIFHHEKRRFLGHGNAHSLSYRNAPANFELRNGPGFIHGGTVLPPA